LARPRKTKELFKIELLAKHNGEVEIIGDYKGSNTKTSFKCNICQNEWMARPESILMGTKCPECSKKSVKSRESFLTKLEKKHGTRIRALDEYIKATIKIAFMCKICNHVWMARPANILSGKGCPQCANNKMKKSFERVLNDIETAHNGNIELIGSYINNCTKTMFRCMVCNNKWLSVPHHVMHGHGCPKCNFSKGEKSIENYLKANNFKHQPQYLIKGCKNKRSMPFDYAVFINNKTVLIEYDGIFHYKDVFKKKDLMEQQGRDKIKDIFCKNNNIKLIRIPYWEHKNIEKILDSQLNTF